ncbi:hypothetical protein SGLAM104S_07657 [Streptomyces glaucescens]
MDEVAWLVYVGFGRNAAVPLRSDATGGPQAEYMAAQPRPARRRRRLARPGHHRRQRRVDPAR